MPTPKKKPKEVKKKGLNRGPNANTPRCGSNRRSPEAQGAKCRLPAGYKTDHPGFGPCHIHGGFLKDVRAKYVKDRLMADANKILEREGHPEPVTDPLSKLAEIAGEVVAWKERVKLRVDAMTASEWRYEHDAGEQLRAELQLWERALDRCERFLGAMARLNIDERLAKIEEKQADAIIEAIQKTLRDMNMPLAQQTEARKIAARHLRSITAA